VPSAVPPSFGDAALGDRRAEIRRSALPCIAGALRRSLLLDGVPPRFGPEAPGSIHRRRRSGFHQPPDLSADARRVLVPFIARSSRCPRSLGFALRGVKVAGRTRLEAGAGENRQLRIAGKASIRPRELAEEEPRAASGGDQAGMSARVAEAGRGRAGAHRPTVARERRRSVALRAGFRRSAPAKPEPAEPAADHWQP